MQYKINQKDNVCHDCKQEIVLVDKKIKNGVLLKYDNQGEDVMVFKCQTCYQKDPSLKNFRKCEVYSRVVGYLRPVNQWHIGKTQEFKERKTFVQPQV